MAEAKYLWTPDMAKQAADLIEAVASLGDEDACELNDRGECVAHFFETECTVKAARAFTNRLHTTEATH